MTTKKVKSKSLLFLGALLLVSGVFCEAIGKTGADKAWITYEAEEMMTTGTTVGPEYAPHTIATESSVQRYVTLERAGQYVEFSAKEVANAMVVRFSLPDAPHGGGLNSQLTLLVNGEAVRELALSSKNAWLYGTYPFSNDPAMGKPRNFYDEVRIKDLGINPNDLVRLVKMSEDGVPCTVDLVDLEWVPEPLQAPEGAHSVMEFGAVGDGKTDDTQPLLQAVEKASVTGRSVWVPPGDYKLTRDILVPSNVEILGAGMWHTNFIGDESLYGDADRRVRFKLVGENSRLADFSITGALNYRDDQEANDGVIGAGCSDSVIERIWIEHTKVGVWVYNGTNLRIEGCRFRNMLADGTNFCVGTSGSIVDNCSARGTGDDCFAIWPAAFDQGYEDKHVIPGNNVIRRSTGQLTFLANGISVYGGANNRVEDCELIDIGTGCGILISTTFPTSDESRGIDNNFSGETLIQRNTLLRCGGYDHSWAWRGSLQICMDRKSISGLTLRDLELRDSFSGGITVVAPGSKSGQGTLSSSRLDQVSVDGVGLSGFQAFDLFVRDDAQGGITLENCELDSVQVDSESFTLNHE